MQPKLRKVGRVKPKYNAEPTAREKFYHRWLMATFPCICDCQRPATVVHHPLTRHPLQRWRRDHEYVVPMNGDCHMELHANGDEAKWRPYMNLAYRAAGYRTKAIEIGVLSDGP